MVSEKALRRAVSASFSKPVAFESPLSKSVRFFFVSPIGTISPYITCDIDCRHWLLSLIAIKILGLNFKYRRIAIVL